MTRAALARERKQDGETRLRAKAVSTGGGPEVEGRGVLVGERSGDRAEAEPGGNIRKAASS